MMLDVVFLRLSGTVTQSTKVSCRALAEYIAAIKMEQALRMKGDCTSEKRFKRAYDNGVIKKSRKHYGNKRAFAAPNPKF